MRSGLGWIAVHVKASALETIHPDNSYLFCSNSAYATVYYSGNHSQSFAEDDLKVAV